MSYNTWIVLIGASLLGMVCAAVGTFGVLRRQALLGDVMAHTALAGAALAVWVSGTRSLPIMLATALLTGALGLLLMEWLRRVGRLRTDAAQALVLATGFGLGIVLSRVVQNVSPAGARSGLDGFLYGKAASLVRQDVFLLAAVAALLLGAIVLLWHRLKLTCFDPEGATSQGLAASRWVQAMNAALALVVIVALPMAGIVLAAGLTILPVLAARFWTDRLAKLLGLAMILGGATAAGGIALSAAQPGWPAGPSVVLMAGLAFLVSFLFAPKRGLLGQEQARIRGVRAIQLRAHLLATQRGLTGPVSPEGEREARRRGLIDGTLLTPAGSEWLRSEEARLGR